MGLKKLRHYHTKSIPTVPLYRYLTACYGYVYVCLLKGIVEPRHAALERETFAPTGLRASYLFPTKLTRIFMRYISIAGRVESFIPYSLSYV